MRYNQPYKTSEIDPKKIRKDDIIKPGRWMCRGCTVMQEKINSDKIWLSIRIKKNALLFRYLDLYNVLIFMPFQILQY